MIANDYGVGRLMIEGEPNDHTCVQFGDGKTRIFTTVWDDNNVGIKIAQTKDDLPAFEKCDYTDGTSPYNVIKQPHETKGEQVHLLFDNPKSIDSLISQLEYIKSVITK